jgi:hypothetical protein
MQHPNKYYHLSRHFASAHDGYTYAVTAFTGCYFRPTVMTAPLKSESFWAPSEGTLRALPGRRMDNPSPIFLSTLATRLTYANQI